MAADAVSDRKIKDDDIERAREQTRRVSIAADGPIQVHRESMHDKSCHPDQRQDHPMTSKAVKEDVAERDGSDCPGVEPKKHSNVVCRPEVVRYPLNKSSIQKRFVQEVDDVCCEEPPKKYV